MSGRREVLRYQLALAWFMLLASAALALFTQDLFGMIQLSAAVGHVTYRFGRLDEFNAHVHTEQVSEQH